MHKTDGGLKGKSDVVVIQAHDIRYPRKYLKENRNACTMKKMLLQDRKGGIGRR